MSVSFCAVAVVFAVDIRLLGTVLCSAAFVDWCIVSAAVVYVCGWEEFKGVSTEPASNVMS